MRLCEHVLMANRKLRSAVNLIAGMIAMLAPKNGVSDVAQLKGKTVAALQSTGTYRMVRALIKDGQVFHRCAVNSINSKAYASGTSTEVGRVTAIYGKTRASASAPWVYGWVIHSHQPKLPDGSYGARVFHVTACPTGGC